MLFREDCLFTDDTVMTVAVAEAINNGAKSKDFIDSMKAWVGYTPMPVMVVGSAGGYSLMIVSPTTVGAMARR